MKPTILTKAQLAANPNHACNISQQTQDRLRTGNALLIADIGEALNLRDTTIAVAQMYTHLFFLSRTYLEYERGLVCCAAILIASKSLYERVRINDLCVHYWQCVNKCRVCPPMLDQ